MIIGIICELVVAILKKYRWQTQNDCLEKTKNFSATLKQILLPDNIIDTWTRQVNESSHEMH